MDIKVVTICGSMRFFKQMQKIATELELKNGWCVIQCVYDLESQNPTKQQMNNIVNAHFKKIDISDAIFVVNVDGYIGESTKNEIQYAKSKNKGILYLEDI